MEADAVKWFGLLIGLVIVVSAAVLAIRQNTTSWQHVFIFALGGVLAGISSVQFSVDPNGAISATIGQVKEAASQTASASLAQSEAIDALRTRVDNLQSAIAAQQTVAANAAAPQAGQVKQFLTLSTQGNTALLQSLERSRTFSHNAQSLIAARPDLVVKPAPGP